MLKEPHGPVVIKRVEERLDVSVKHPIHPPLGKSDTECIQGVMLVTPGSEPIGEAKEVHLVDRRQNRDDRLLDNLVLQRGNPQRSLSSVWLWNKHSPRRQSSVTA